MNKSLERPIETTKALLQVVQSYFQHKTTIHRYCAIALNCRFSTYVEGFTTHNKTLHLFRTVNDHYEAELLCFQRANVSCGQNKYQDFLGRPSYLRGMGANYCWGHHEHSHLGESCP
jgi:hypothetical protein